jgi:hypothetical protein
MMTWPYLKPSRNLASSIHKMGLTSQNYLAGQAHFAPATPHGRRPRAFMTIEEQGQTKRLTPSLSALLEDGTLMN